jgi:hypothetical protein
MLAPPSLKPGSSLSCPWDEQEALTRNQSPTSIRSHVGTGASDWQEKLISVVAAIGSSQLLLLAALYHLGQPAPTSPPKWSPTTTDCAGSPKGRSAYQSGNA